MVKIFKTSFLQIKGSPKAPRYLPNVFSPEIVLVTNYDSDADLGRLINQGEKNHNLSIKTGIGTHFVQGNRSKRVFSGNRESSQLGAPIEEYQNELTKDHVLRCATLEGRFGTQIEQIGNVFTFYEGFVTSIGDQVSGSDKVCTLETKFRAPRYFLPDGFVVQDSRLFDIKVYSEARIKKSGVTHFSGIFTADGVQILLETATIRPQLIETHRGTILAFLEMIKGHYYHGDHSFSAQDLLEDRAEVLSYVDHWDYKQNQLMQNAKRIAHAMYESELKDKIKGIVLYGSLARQDKVPGDIDILLLVDSSEGHLNPFKYFKVDDKGIPTQYNVSDVTNGIARELGIVPKLLTIGRKSRDPYTSYPDEASYIQFSDVGGGINLSVVSTDFLNDPALQEKYMRLCFTPTYFQDALTDGFVFNEDTRTFSIPTREVYASVVDALKDQHQKAIIEQWPNIGNVKPQKKF